MHLFEHFEGKEANDQGVDQLMNHCICAKNSQNSLNACMAQEAHSISAAMTSVEL